VFVTPCLLVTAAALLTAESPALQPCLEKLDTDWRHGGGFPILGLEADGQKLLAAYPAPVDRGRIYFQLALVYTQSDIRRYYPQVRKYGRLALRHTADANRRAILHSYLGSAGRVDPGLSAAEQRAAAAEEWLAGYREALALDLPAVAPELPRVEKLGGIWPLAAEDLARHEVQVRARRRAEFVRDMLGHRDLFVRQLAEGYGRVPAGDELNRLATRILADEAAVAQLLAQVYRQ